MFSFLKRVSVVLTFSSPRHHEGVLLPLLLRVSVFHSVVSRDLMLGGWTEEGVNFLFFLPPYVDKKLFSKCDIEQSFPLRYLQSWLRY